MNGNGNIDRTKHVENFLVLENVRAASWKFYLVFFFNFNAYKKRKFTVKPANKTNKQPTYCGAKKMRVNQLKKNGKFYYNFKFFRKMLI